MPKHLLSALFSALVLVMAPLSARAAELVMVSADWCVVCEQWEEEVGVAYPKTAEAKIAPLRRVEYGAADLQSMTLKKRVDTTPTFLLLNNGVEIARIEGYTADHFFWSELGQILAPLSTPRARED